MAVAGTRRVPEAPGKPTPGSFGRVPAGRLEPIDLIVAPPIIDDFRFYDDLNGFFISTASLLYGILAACSPTGVDHPTRQRSLTNAVRII